MKETILFRNFLKTAFDGGLYTNDDLVAFVLPLFKETAVAHEDGMVLPFEDDDSLVVDNGSVSFKDKVYQQPVKKSVPTPVESGNLPQGYSGFEIPSGFHDALSDIFSLGLVLGSMAMGLDLYNENDRKIFHQYRHNPSYKNNRLHPVISSLITIMTEPDRNLRLQDVNEALFRLENYRDLTDLFSLNPLQPANKEGLSKNNGHSFVLNQLRNRLFDISRRNRLLYYKPNTRFIDLTLASIPIVLDAKNINPELVFSWNNDIGKEIISSEDLLLNKYLRFDDHPYLEDSLDKIRLEVNHDIREYGFSQLKLVIAFFHWFNLKEDREELIKSPLLLLPVTIQKVRRITEDHYIISAQSSEAEANPVLSNYLKEIYGINLPATIELEDISVREFYNDVKLQIDSARQGIELELIDQPDSEFLYKNAKQIVAAYNKKLAKTSDRNEKKDQSVSVGQTDDQKQVQNFSIIQNEFPKNPDNEEDEVPLSPFKWKMDVCNMVLGNFNYKKMSLVEDYNSIIEENIESSVFRQLFSDRPKEGQEIKPDLNDPENWFHVLTADPTQIKSILQARTGMSYIIQGPPGTGKSQTITNLIADFVARDKKVLFVCEKRAALDVVFHRLKQYGLDELCCYIHDSQNDKKSFIKDLSDTYETFMNKRLDLHKIREERSWLLSKLVQHLTYLRNYHLINTYNPEAAGIEVRKLIERLILLKPHIRELAPIEEELLPFYKEWNETGQAIAELSEKLVEAGTEPFFSAHPFSKVRDNIFLNENPLKRLSGLVGNAQTYFEEIEKVFLRFNIPSDKFEKFVELRALIENAILLFPVAEHDQIKIIDPANFEAQQFETEINSLKLLQEQYKNTQEENGNWVNKPGQQETINAIEIASKYEHSFWRHFSSKWRRLKKSLHTAYNFSAHAIFPGYLNILTNLNAEYELDQKQKELHGVLEHRYHFTSLETAYLAVQRGRSRLHEPEVQFILQASNPNDLVKGLYKLNNTIRELDITLKQVIYDHDKKLVINIQGELDTIQANTDHLNDLLPQLRNFARLPDIMKKVLRTLSLTPVQLEADIAFKTIRHIYGNNKEFADADASSIGQSVLQVERLMEDLLKVNALLIRAKVHDQFLRHASAASGQTEKLSEEDKAFIRDYASGRKILENEFGKTMRYKSIREIANRESGKVLKDLKPVWLMSPLSVSDSLPLDEHFFDVVIFDEASQITVEEGVPSLFRATQAIIVGDEKQMPPTRFFSARSQDPDDLMNADDTEETISNDAESLLSQGTRSLSSVMLGWHYRSRYETLISYSNHAFYFGQLLTVPDKMIHSGIKAPIIVNAGQAAFPNIDLMADRTISFHYLPDSVYEKRANKDEAVYIAELVREFLKRKVKETIGIVAFSMEQQHAIENALYALSSRDKEFGTLLEQAFNRQENDQFAGLFVKNLENVQGDERDIIIMSICYGYDRNKKMRMNFGPVNRKGGEKRLNVIFSRSKQHMAVVSSIKHTDITNDYNDGANYLKLFLQYAEEVSTGNMNTARSILDRLILKKGHFPSSEQQGFVAGQIKEMLEEKGYDVHIQVGQSDFKCTLAVKLKPDDQYYSLAILLDDDSHFANENIMEQYYQRPAILKEMGWRLISVFTKDWLHDPEKVSAAIIKALHGQKDHTAEFYNSQLAASLSINTKNNYDELNFHRLVVEENDISKFWEVATDQQRLIIRSGRVGAKGQTIVKRYPSKDAAETEKQKMLKEKKEKGYKEN